MSPRWSTEVLPGGPPVRHLCHEADLGQALHRVRLQQVHHFWCGHLRSGAAGLSQGTEYYTCYKFLKNSLALQVFSRNSTTRDIFFHASDSSPLLKLTEILWTSNCVNDEGNRLLCSSPSTSGVIDISTKSFVWVFFVISINDHCHLNLRITVCWKNHAVQNKLVELTL